MKFLALALALAAFSGFSPSPALAKGHHGHHGHKHHGHHHHGHHGRGDRHHHAGLSLRCKITTQPCRPYRD